MNPILRFVVIAYALSIALSLVVGLTGGYESPFIGLKYLSMVLPAIAVLIVATTTGEGPRLGDAPFSFRYLPVAVFLIPARGDAADNGDRGRHTVAGLVDAAERRPVPHAGVAWVGNADH